jgi:DNA-directed RNA polymerase subunit M/transcription elongation factor TFIIS
MYYISIDINNDNDTLQHYCKKCGNVKKYNDDNEIICVSNTNLGASTNENNFINKYTKHDPTLPRVDNIPCPNELCKTNTHDEYSETIYVRTDDINMKYIYICSICDTTWNINN